MTSTTPSTQETPLRYDLYLNYSIYCCWGNLLWVLHHADLPLDTLVEEALDVYRIFSRNCSHFETDCLTITDSCK